MLQNSTAEYVTLQLKLVQRYFKEMKGVRKVSDLLIETLTRSGNGGSPKYRFRAARLDC